MPRMKHNHRRRKNKGLAKVKRDIKWLKQGVEFKFFDQTTAGGTLNLTGSIEVLNNMAGGTTESTRVGTEIHANRILITGFVSNRNGTPSDTICRLMLVRDRYPQATAPTIADILGSAGSLLVNEHRNMINKGRFKVMVDYRWSMDTVGHSLVPFKILFKLDHVVKYTDGSADDPETNGLYIIGISTITAGANAPTMDFDSRYSYTDS